MKGIRIKIIFAVLLLGIAAFKLQTELWPPLSAEDRQQAEILCKIVEYRYAVVAKLNKIPADEWRLILARYQREEALGLHLLKMNPPVISDCTGPVLRDLARRMQR